MTVLSNWFIKFTLLKTLVMGKTGAGGTWKTELSTHFFHKPKIAFQNLLSYTCLGKETKTDLQTVRVCVCYCHLAHD